MSEQEEKICDRCRKRPATSFIDYGEAGRVENVCEICLTSPDEWDYSRVMPSTEQIKEAIEKRNGKCMHCGEPAKRCTYWLPSFSQSSMQSLDDGGRRFQLLCEKCHEDEGEFYINQADSSPEGSVDDDPAKRLLQLSADLDEFMKKKIEQRKTDGAGN